MVDDGVLRENVEFLENGCCVCCEVRVRDYSDNFFLQFCDFFDVRIVCASNYCRTV